MRQKTKLFCYQLKMDMLAAFGILAVAALLTAVELQFTEISILSAEVIIWCGYQNYFYPYAEYQAFGFCRKTFYYQQVFAAMIRAVIFSIYLTVERTIFHDAFIQEFVSETTEDIHRYHQLPMFELFFSAFLFCTCFHLLMLVKNNNILHTTEHKTLQQKWRKEHRKKKHPYFYWLSQCFRVVKFLLMIIFIVIGVRVVYQVQLTSEFSVRLKIMLAYGVGILVLYFIGRWNYRPKYL